MRSRSLVEYLLDELDADGALADRGRDALDARRAHVAYREDAWTTRLEEEGPALLRPLRCSEMLVGQIRPGQDEALRVRRDHAVQPPRLRIGARHREQVAYVMGGHLA